LPSTVTIASPGKQNVGGRDGLDDGLLEGIDDGLLDGIDDGLLEGIDDGLLEGIDDGLLEGIDDGLLEGKDDGLLDGIDDGAVVLFFFFFFFFFLWRIRSASVMMDKSFGLHGTSQDVIPSPTRSSSHMHSYMWGPTAVQLAS
jgi:hypothetical protein